MNLSIREQSPFSRVRDALFGNNENYRQFQNALNANPRAGAVIQGTGGARKVRWADRGRGKGKSGGIRVIYLYVEEFDTILLLLAYNKQIPDLTPKQKQTLELACKAFRSDLETGVTT